MFDPKSDFLLKNLLGEGFEEDLKKSALFKLPTNTTVEPEELFHALQVVPKALISWLKLHLEPMSPGEAQTIDLSPLAYKAKDHTLYINKKGPDVYIGEIVHKGEVKARLFNRALPSVGLTLLTLFELYSLDTPQVQPVKEDNTKEIHDIIDRRVRLYNTVESIIDRKFQEMQAVKYMISGAILENSNLKDREEVNIDDFRSHLEVKTKKKSPIADIIKKRKAPQVIIAKSETHSCPDCGSTIFKKGDFSPCVCFESDVGDKIFIAKTEDRVILKFSDSWEPENIELLLEAIKQKAHPHEES